MGGIDDTLTAAGGLGMGRHLTVAMADADPPTGNHDAHTLADEPPRHAVGVGVDLDRAIGLDPAHQLAQLTERRAAVERAQRASFNTPEPLDRRLPGGAVNPRVGDLALPVGEMGFKCTPAGKAVSGDGIVLDVADAALVLALGARPVRRARPRPEPPIIGEGAQPHVEADLAGRRIMVIDQRPGAVEQHFARHPAKVAKRPLNPLEPRRLPLVAKGLHKDPARIAQRRHKQIDAHALAADRDPGLAEIDLQLVARRCLKTQRRPRLGAQLPAQMRHRPLYRAQAYRKAVLALEILAHDVGIAAVPAKPRGQPIGKPTKRLRTARRAVAHPTFRRQIASHRAPIAATASGASDPPAAAPAAALHLTIPSSLAPPLVNRGGALLVSLPVQFYLSPDRAPQMAALRINLEQCEAAKKRRPAGYPKCNFLRLRPTSP